MISNSNVVKHHTHYKEIHGYDKTVWLTHSEHEKLHNRLRKEGKCNIPVGELTRISNAAYQRTEKSMEHDRDYMRNYRQNFTQRISFCDTVDKNIFHREEIEYNHKTGNVIVSGGFRGNNGCKLIMRDLA